MDPSKQNVGWRPLCPATVEGEQDGCEPDNDHRQYGCNPAALVADSVDSQLKKKIAAAEGQEAAAGAGGAMGSTAGCAGGAAIPCKLGKFSAWGACSVSCGSGGQQRRSRVILQNPSCGGTACGNCFILVRLRQSSHTSPGAAGRVEEAQACRSAILCADDCQVSKWGQWNRCSKSCDGGFSMRHRKLLVRGKGNCPELTDTKPCNTKACHKCPKSNCVMAVHRKYTSRSLHACTFDLRSRSCTCAGQCPLSQ
jgi:hypothetical protein